MDRDRQRQTERKREACRQRVKKEGRRIRIG